MYLAAGHSWENLPSLAFNYRLPFRWLGTYFAVSLGSWGNRLYVYEAARQEGMLTQLDAPTQVP